MNRSGLVNQPPLCLLANRPVLEPVGVAFPVDLSAEPSSQDGTALGEAIRECGVPPVLGETTVRAKTAWQVAQDTGLDLVALCPG